MKTIQIINTFDMDSRLDINKYLYYFDIVYTNINFYNIDLFYKYDNYLFIKKNNK